MVKEKMTKNFFSLRIFSRFRFLKHFWWNSFDLNQKVKLNLLTLLLGTSLKIVFYLWTCDLSLHNSFILIFKWKQFTSQARIIFQTRSFIFKKDTFYKIYCKYFITKKMKFCIMDSVCRIYLRMALKLFKIQVTVSTTTMKEIMMVDNILKTHSAV